MHRRIGASGARLVLLLTVVVVSRDSPWRRQPSLPRAISPRSRAQATAASPATVGRPPRPNSAIPPGWRSTAPATSTSPTPINDRVRKVDARGRSPPSPAPAPRASPATGARPPRPSSTSPGGVAVDGSGNLYIADSDNHASARWTARGRSPRSPAPAPSASPATAARPPRPSSTVPRGGGRRLRQPLHRRHRQPPGPQGGRLGDDHHRRRHRHRGLLRRRRPGHLGPAQRSRGVAVDGSGNLYIADYATTASAR